MSRGQLVFAIGTGEEHALHRLLAQDVIDEAERCAPRPLHVIHAQHHRPVPRRDRPQQLCTSSSQAYLCRQRVPRIRWHPQQRRDLRDHRGQQSRIRAYGSDDPFTDLRQLLLRFGQQQPTQRAEHLISGLELQIPPILVELAGDEPAVPARHHCPELIDPRGLSGARRPADEQASTPAGQRILERCPKRRNLLVASRQARRRQQSHGDVVRADSQRRALAGRGVPQPLQVVEQAIRRLVSAVGLLLQQMHDDLGESHRYGRVDLSRRRRLLCQVSMDEPNGSPEPNGGSPVASSYSVAPSAYRSDR
jgi:hypothetical protein